MMICLVRAGAGVSIKLAESLYNHMPVLATTLAIRGLECLSGAELIVKDSAEEWAMFLNSAAADDFATQTPAEALRRQFSSDGHVEKLTHFLSAIILRPKPAIIRIVLLMPVRFVEAHDVFRGGIKDNVHYTNDPRCAPH